MAPRCASAPNDFPSSPETKLAASSHAWCKVPKAFAFFALLAQQGFVLKVALVVC